ncbi:MAG: Glutathione transport system permease protein GsiC [Acetothermia bacterium 64_32]|nr:MAG: Glutathione transport system permease protein GsiC [Acetothermia bacterium 64_32]
MVFILFAVSVLTFLMVHLVPGDPARVMAGIDASQEDIELMRKKLGLDLPLHVQYLRYIGAVLRGDLGESIRTGRPLAESLLARFPATAELAVISLLIALLIAIPAGVISATKANTVWDYLTMTTAVLGVSMPSFWRGLMLMLLFSLTLRWLPASGRGEPFLSWEWLRHIILPSLTLGLGAAAMLSRLTRSSLLEVLNQNYVTTARSKGLSERRVVMRHALRNALIPVVTMAGMQFGWLLGGTVVIESVFAWPGIGRLLVHSIFARDFPVIRGGVLLMAASFSLINLAVDLLYGLLDPRIRYE